MMTTPGAPSLQHSPRTAEKYPPTPGVWAAAAGARPLVDGALRAEGLAVRGQPSAAAPAGRSDLDQRRAGTLGAGSRQELTDSKINASSSVPRGRPQRSKRS